MKNHASYEDWGFSSITPVTEPVQLTEQIRGVQAVGWYRGIENQIVGMVQKAEKNKDRAEANELNAFLQTWRSHPIDGSINREDVEILGAAAAQLGAREAWTPASYFRALQKSLDQLKAGEEELPRGGPTGADAPRHRGSVSPPSTSFGPENDSPDGTPLDAKDKPQDTGKEEKPTDQNEEPPVEGEPKPVPGEKKLNRPPLRPA